MKNILLLACFFLFTHNLSAQKENNVWCFGFGCGMDFKNGAPVFFPGTVMHQLEGCASIAGTNGNLLFYTDGDTAWNKNNLVMPNGTGLKGNPSSAQSALIINSLSNNNQYYVFTAEAFDGSFGGNGLNYSVVDMTLQGGLGDVMPDKKNKHLLDRVDERIVATPFANGQGMWVVVTSQGGATIDAFRLTSSGIDSVPVVSANAGVNEFYSACMKFSPDGARLAIALHSNEFDILDFDRATGMASNPVHMNGNPYNTAYGVEFSPNGKYLYGTASGYLYQFDLTAADIGGSAVKVFTSPNALGSMQLAPDGKIYFARYNTSYVGVISNPDALGPLCNPSDTGFRLPSGICQYGLPNLFVFEPVFSGIKDDVDQYAGSFIFPNPVNNNTCMLKMPAAFNNEPYILFDITGHPLKEGMLTGNTTTFALDGLPPGIYLLQAGSARHIYKVVKA